MVTSTLTASIITALVGLTGVVIGTLIGHYFNQQLSMRNSRKDVIFKRKLEYFEKLAETIEMNIRVYKNSLISIKSNDSRKNIEQVIKEMKENRKNFKIMASPLYFNVQNISKKVIDFVNTEKEIFSNFEEMEKKKPSAKGLTDIESKINLLKSNANKILNEMRAEMKADLKIKI